MSINESENIDEKYIRLSREFVDRTQTNSIVAMMQLQKHNWDLDKAVEDHFNALNGTSASIPKRLGPSQSDIIIDLCSDSGSDSDLSSSPEPGYFTLLSWNIDGLCEKSLIKRTKAVIQVIKNEFFHVVCLQEVVTSTLTMLHDQLTDQFVIFSANQHPLYQTSTYFTVILVRKNRLLQIRPDSFQVKPFDNSQMDRHLASIDIDFLLPTFSSSSPSSLTLRLATAHLESCRESTTVRCEQLRQSLHCLDSFVHASSSSYRAALLCGDLNLRDSEAALVRSKFSSHLPLVDAWEATGSRRELRSTWDPNRNVNAAALLTGLPQRSNKFFSCRFDRIYSLANDNILKPVDFGLRGLEKVSQSSCFPSDHWAVMARFVLFNNH